MPTFLKTKSLGYDDIVSIAQPGAVASRSEIPVEGRRLVVSAMTAIVSDTFLEAVAKLPYELQPTVHIPRDVYALENLALAKRLKLKNIFVGVGLDTPYLEQAALDFDYNVILLDVANGYLPTVRAKVRDLVKKGFKVITGSVHTARGAHMLVDAGCFCVRSGISSGNVCVTKSMTSFTRGTVSEIIDLCEIKHLMAADNEWEGYKVLADGGFRTPADLVKAFLLGADYCMSGKLYVDAQEARLRVDLSNVYYGMASEKGKVAMGKEVRHVEGTEEKLSTNNVRPLKEILEDMWMAIRSGVSYSGYRTLSEAIGNGVFEIKYNK